MDCSKAKNSFWDYRERKLEEEESKHFSEHLLSCARCRKEFALFSNILEHIESEKISSPNPFFVEKTVNKILAPEPETVGIHAWLLSWLGYYKPAFAAATIILSIVVGIYLGLPDKADQLYDPVDAFAETYDLTVGETLFD
jgi:predicted anti-sigma-YlaC factor YlaD